MLDLRLREEFKGKKLKGTTIDFTNQSKTGALDVSASEFLKITYPSFDLLKTIEATGPEQSRPVVLLGDRGQGKSHLLAALYHLCTCPEAGRQWLAEWASQLSNPLFRNLKLRNESCVIAESLHLNRYTFLWDVLFDRHPHGAYCRGMWESAGPEKKTEVPSDLILLEMFRRQPTVLILDEFQTWFDGQTNTRQHPRKKWAFNFIQVLSEIAQSNPELLVLVVSIRESESDAYQQVHRVNPVLVDFKGPQAKRDRQRLLLYRIFENRLQVPPSKIESLVQPHLNEYYRLAKIPQPEQERRQGDFVEAWPYSPLLLKLLDDQVLIATSAQETRDLIKILVDLFKNTDPTSPIITAADFKLNSESSVVASLLDSVANQLHKDLREKAQRNLQAVMDAVPNAKTVLPHCEEIISALWLRSLTVDKLVGADPAELQIDITRGKPIDDNQFAGELANIEENSFNIHRVGSRLVFKSEENPQAKLLAHAKNDKLFQQGEDIDHLAKEVRACISGPEHVSQSYRVVVLKKKWSTDPWSEFEEKDHPKNWDNRLPMVVVPVSPDNLDADLGTWLKTHLQDGRNTIRFLLPQRSTGNIFFDRELVVLARAVHLALQWGDSDPAYRPLKTKFQNELIGKLKGRFDRFAVLDTWNFAETAKCRFEERSHGVQGDKIPETVDKIIKQDVFIPEEFEIYVLKLSEWAESIGKLLKDLREPRPGGNPCIPWLGEVEVKERVVQMCALGQIAINVRGLELLQARPGETYDDAWMRMKGRLGTGKHLDETTMYLPDAVVTSGGKVPVVTVTGNGVTSTIAAPGTGVVTVPGSTGPADISNGGRQTNLFDDSGASAATRSPMSAAPTSGLNLLGQVESWGIGPATTLANVSLRIGKMSGSQLQQLLKHLPDGVTYGLDLEKESN
jgi:hypothetical protein